MMAAANPLGKPEREEECAEVFKSDVLVLTSGEHARAPVRVRPSCISVKNLSRIMVRMIFRHRSERPFAPTSIVYERMCRPSRVLAAGTLSEGVTP